jgi:hypothetical protein
MRPQNPDNAAPAPQPQVSWFQKNWPWLLGLGCGIPSLCCVGGIVVSMVFGIAAQDDLLKAVDQDLKSGKYKDAANAPGQEDVDPVAATDDSVRVDCGTPGPNGVSCDVKRTGGSNKVEACWDLVITCNNGGVMTGAGCAILDGDEQQTKQKMPVDAFDNQDGCDAPKSGAVQDLVVNLVN